MKINDCFLLSEDVIRYFVLPCLSDRIKCRTSDQFFECNCTSKMSIVSSLMKIGDCLLHCPHCYAKLDKKFRYLVDQIRQPGLNTKNFRLERIDDGVFRWAVIDGTHPVIIKEFLSKPIDFSNMNLEYANFRYVDVSKCCFDNCFMRYVDFEGSDVKDVVFNNIEMVDAIFDNSDLTGTKFYDVKLTDASFEGVIGKYTIY